MKAILIGSGIIAAAILIVYYDAVLSDPPTVRAKRNGMGPRFDPSNGDGYDVGRAA